MVSQVDFGDVLLPKLVLGCDPFQILSCFYPNPEEKLSFYHQHFSQPDNIITIVCMFGASSVEEVEENAQYLREMEASKRLLHVKTSIEY